MNKQWLVNFNDTHLALIGLMIFFTFFIGLLFWVYRKESGKVYGQLELKPLEDMEK